MAMIQTVYRELICHFYSYGTSVFVIYREQYVYVLIFHSGEVNITNAASTVLWLIITLKTLIFLSENFGDQSVFFQFEIIITVLVSSFQFI